MGSFNPIPELTLDFKPTFIPKTIAQFFRQLSSIGSVPDKILKLDDFVTRLESEMRKIDAFKRELPLCMLLINDAIIALKEEAMVFKKSSSVEPVLEEFIPLKKSCDEGVEVDVIREEKGGGDKKNWLSSTQLWNTNENTPNMNQIQSHKPNSTDKITKKRAVEEDDRTIDGSHRSFGNHLGKAFIPLKGCYGFTMVGTAGEKDKEELPIPGLSLITPGIGIKNSMRGNNLVTKTSPDTKLTPCFATNDQSTGVPRGHSPQQQSSRKQRRCWSTELHRRFVNALQQLGGSQAATPKQIRELMQVEGLTNDEVKSHLQKYRLHTRRLPSSNTSTVNQTGGVLGGGVWTPPQDQFVESSKHGISQSSSPDGPFLTGTTTTTGGDSMDDGEDAKSENYCWKGV